MEFKYLKFDDVECMQVFQNRNQYWFAENTTKKNGNNASNFLRVGRLSVRQ
jgi:hypothetical protein